MPNIYETYAMQMCDLPNYKLVGYLTEKHAQSHIMTLFLDEQTNQYLAIDHTNPFQEIKLPSLKDHQFIRINSTYYRVNLY